jgi:hypothetical protein
MDISYTSMEIILEEEGNDDVSLCHTIKTNCPRVGEYIWLPYNWERKKEFGRAFRVTDVAHHIGVGLKINYDSVVVFVEKITADPATSNKAAL